MEVVHGDMWWQLVSVVESVVSHKESTLVLHYSGDKHWLQVAKLQEHQWQNADDSLQH